MNKIKLTMKRIPGDKYTIAFCQSDGFTLFSVHEDMLDAPDSDFYDTMRKTMGDHPDTEVDVWLGFDEEE